MENEDAVSDYSELVKRLMRFDGRRCVSSDVEVEAASVIEALVRERDHERAMWNKADLAEAAASRRAERAEAALRDIVRLDDEGGGYIYRLSKCIEIARAVLGKGATDE